MLGGALIVAAVRQWRGRPRGGQVELPSWVASLERFSVLRSAAVGAAITGLNPKNLLLAAGAAAAIAVAAFVLVGILAPAVPALMFFVMGERAARPLDELQGVADGQQHGDTGGADARDRRQARPATGSASSADQWTGVKSSAVTTGRDSGAGWSTFEYGRFRRCR